MRMSWSGALSAAALAAALTESLACPAGAQLRQPGHATLRVPGWSGFERMRRHMSARAVARATQRMPGGEGSRPARPAPHPGPVAGASASGGTTFRPQAAELAPALMAADAGGDREDVRRQLSGFLAAYRERLRGSGGPQNDVARAGAFLADVSHRAYFGRAQGPAASFEALRIQLQVEFLASPDFRRKGDRDRQMEFELYAILGTMIATMAYDQAIAPTPARAQLLRRLARESFVGLMGVPPERVRMTAAGYEISGR